MILKIDNLLVSKNDQVVCKVPTLQVAKGQKLLIHGPNGIGKSTLLRVIAGLERPTSGFVELDLPIGQCTLVHQSPILFSMTVRQNVEFGLRSRNISKPNRRERADRWLEKLGIADLADRKANQVSGGERKRIAIARAMVFDPELLLLDEPFSEMDANGQDRVQSIIAESHSTILLTSPEIVDDYDHFELGYGSKAESA